MIIYGNESLVLTEEILTVLEGFHHQVARQIVGNTYKNAGDSWW